MKTIKTSSGTTVSYSVAGTGPPLVLVRGAFSDHETNWAFVRRDVSSGSLSMRLHDAGAV
jgi:hypothetical protein